MIEARRGVPALLALMVAAFSYLTVEILPVGLLPDIAADLDVSLSQVGLLVSGYGLTVAVFSVPLTHLVSGIPRRHLITGLLAIFVVSTVISVLGGYWLLLGGRVVTALSQAVFWSIAAPAAAALFPPQARGRAVAAVFGGSSLAPVLGVPAATWLGQQAGWRTAFLTVAGLALVAMAGVAVLLPTTAPRDGHAAAGAAPDARAFWLLIIVTGITITGVFTAYTYLTPFLTDIGGFSASTVSALLLVFGVTGLGGVALAGYLADRHPRLAVRLPVALLALTLLGLPLAGAHPAAVIGLVGLWGFALPQVPTTFQSQMLVVAPGSTDLASATLSGVYNLGIAGGALLGGLLLPHTGLRGVYLTGGAVLIAAFLVLAVSPALARRRERGEAPAGGLPPLGRIRR
ncbi:MFS transporter [Actinoplanes sp. NPDC024001]|uniref:MFS transporter n=1 Tax=Actinoplanes sp. NPDC024001 TaxID=3154598 RepID=UPI0033F05D1D